MHYVTIKCRLASTNTGLQGAWRIGSILLLRRIEGETTCAFVSFTQRFPRAGETKVIRRRDWATKKWVVATLTRVLLLLGVGRPQTVVTASANVPFDLWAQGRKF